MTKRIQYWLNVFEDYRPGIIAHDATPDQDTLTNRAIYMLFIYSTQYFNTYGHLLRHEFFKNYGYGFLRASSVFQIPMGHGHFLEDIIEKLARILKGKPIYKDDDLYLILLIIQNKHRDADVFNRIKYEDCLSQFKFAERPSTSMIDNFCFLFSCCRRKPSAALKENLLAEHP